MEKKERFIPFKYKLSIIITIFSIIIIAFVGNSQYYNLSNALQQEHAAQRGLLENNMIHALNAMDLTYNVLERNIESRMRVVSAEIISEYEEVGSISKVDLAKYQGKIQGLDISLINDRLIVSRTTNPSVLYLDYKLWPDIEMSLKTARSNQEFATDRVRLSLVESEIKKYAYEPTADGKYIVELAIDMSQYGDVFKNVDFNSIANDMIQSHDAIYSITLYNNNGKAYGKKNSDLSGVWVAPQNFQYFKNALKNQQSVEVVGEYAGEKALYKYIPIKNLGTLGKNKANVVEIVFNENALNKTLDRYRSIADLVIILLIAVSILLGIITSNFITKPINKIMDAINAIEEGNFNYHANIKTRDEFKRLSNSLDKMVARIKKLVEERNEHIEALNAKNAEIVLQKDEINALYEETTAMNEELEHMVDEVRKNYLSTVQCLANAIEAKDEYTRGHCERVTGYSVAIGEALGLFQDDIYDLRFAGVLHDVGKIGIPSQVLTKESKLTDEEFAVIKKHPEIGYNIIKDIAFLERSRKIVYQHHERLDGRGYPRGLNGDGIDKLSRILTVADAYDAMTSSRPYRYTPLSKEQAIEQMERNKGTQFDAEIVDIFVKLLKEEDLQ